MIGPVTLNGACVFGIGGTALALTGPVGGSGGLIKNLASPLYLYGADNYTGGTVINGGKLAIVSPGSITATTNISVAPGAMLDVSGLGAGGMTLAAGQTLGGFGSVNGNFTVGSGATLAPGNAIGVLTFDNALTLSAGSTNILAISKSPTTNAQIVVLGGLAQGGTFVVTNICATPLAAGDAFAPFNAASYSGSFSAILPARPGPALAWDTSSLTNSGILRVMAVPPPRIGSMTMSAGTMILSGNGGLPAGLPYYLLASTNLPPCPSPHNGLAHCHQQLRFKRQLPHHQPRRPLRPPHLLPPPGALTVRVCPCASIASLFSPLSMPTQSHLPPTIVCACCEEE